MQVTAVIVTYNRFELLKECIAAVKAQTYKASSILVVNNNSTDGTTEWLNKQPDLITIHQLNKGGAWGFYTGLKEAYKTGADWFWVMDDDTIPSETALEKLVGAIGLTKDEKDVFGFFASKVVWTDGSLHLMNKPGIATKFSGYRSFEYYQAKGIIPLSFNSFVSILISKEAVKKCGLPIKEFFIWNDDVEYTQRVLQYGFAGGLVEESVVVHKTPVNYQSDIFLDTKANLWKYSYGMRNRLYIRRQQKGRGSYFRNIFKNCFVMPFHIALKRKTNRWAYTKMIWKSSLAAMRFNPTIEYIPNSEKTHRQDES
jgi:rhamnopyranosyl-N-acetylglucosaminyl-diphospho-decaprenol beta-1,3/1,4-galactofuranosyltransferase